MQVNINITLTQDDIDAGLTADAAVQKAFPTGSTVAPYVDQSLIQDNDSIKAAAEEAAQEELDEQAEIAAPSGPATVIEEPEAPEFAEGLAEEPVAETNFDQLMDANDAVLAAPAGVELDSAGVPWCAEIHSSNKKVYGATSKEPGRWIWKKGSDIVARATRASELAAQHTAGAEVVADIAEAAPPAATEAAPPAAVAPPAENAAPPAAAVPPTAAPIEAIPPATGELPATWPAFLQSLKQSGKTAGDITPLLASAGVETIAQLASNDEARNTIASQLGLIA